MCCVPDAKINLNHGGRPDLRGPEPTIVLATETGKAGWGLRAPGRLWTDRE